LAVLGSLLLLAGCGAFAAESITVVRRANSQTGDVRPTELMAWYPLMNGHEWPGEMLLGAVQIAEQPIRLTTIGHDIIEDEYFQQLLAAAEAGRAPDVAYISTPDALAEAVNAGIVEPLSDCRAAQPAFEGIREIAWTAATGRGETWAAPAAVSVNVLFYNKEKLRALGWSTAEIDSLPARIEAGAFTLYDLRDTAAEAVAAGVVEPGYGFTQRPTTSSRISYYYTAFGGRPYDAEQDRLVIDRAALARAYAFRLELVTDEIMTPFILDGGQNTWSSRLLWHDVIAHGRVLFWNGLPTDWEKWEAIAASVTEEASVLTNDQLGLALMPSAAVGRPSIAEIGMSYFAILNERATGRQGQRAACALLAAAATPAVARPPLAGSGWVSAVRDTAAAGDGVVENVLHRAGAEAMLNRALAPASAIDHDFLLYRTTLVEFAQQAQAGQMTPDEAATAAVRQLRLALGDDLIVE
jgi:inositol-phosphate transport system substrate-binding protein